MNKPRRRDPGFKAAHMGRDLFACIAAAQKNLAQQDHICNSAHFFVHTKIHFLFLFNFSPSPQQNYPCPCVV